MANCRKSAAQGYELTQESFSNLESTLREEKSKLQAANLQQENIRRLENDEHFSNQIDKMEKLEKDTINIVENNLRTLKSQMDEFAIIVYGRTIAGKSMLMEILTHGDGSSIGKGAQHTTLNVRAYSLKGLKIFDVPGIGAFNGAAYEKTTYETSKSVNLALFLLISDASQPEMC